MSWCGNHEIVSILKWCCIPWDQVYWPSTDIRKHRQTFTRPNERVITDNGKWLGTGMTKYRIECIITGTYVGPLAKRHCTALHHATNYRQVAGDAGVRTVGTDVLFECPVVATVERTTGWCRYASWRTICPQQQHGAFKNCWRRTTHRRRGKYAVDAVVWSND